MPEHEQYTIGIPQRPEARSPMFASCARESSATFGVFAFPHPAFCGTLGPMGSKDKGKKEPKKAPKPKPKPEPGRRREGFTPAPPK
jgi:hypothetical protein